MIEEESEKIDHVDHFFSGQTHSLLVPEQDFNGLDEFQTHKYFYESYSLKRDVYSFHRDKDPTPEQFKRFFEIMSGKLRKVGTKIRENENSLTGMVEGSLIKISKEGFDFDLGYKVLTFGPTQGAHREFSIYGVDSVTLSELNFNFPSYSLEERTGIREYVSLSPPDIILESKTIDDILKNNEFI